MVRWNITKENLALLDDIRDIEVGTLDLHCRDVGNEERKRITRFVKEHGNLLREFSLRPQWSSEKEDFEHFDFAVHCPHLQLLDLKQVIVNESVFAHPSLEVFQLAEAEYKGSRDITLGGSNESDGRQLKEIGIIDCLFYADKLTIGSFHIVAVKEKTQTNCNASQFGPNEAQRNGENMPPTASYPIT